MRSSLLPALALSAFLAGCGGGGAMSGNPNDGVIMAPSASWDQNATGWRDQVGSRHTLHCPAGGTPQAVWGSGTYTDDSSICTAAVHAGRITMAAGGYVTIEMRPGQASYSGTTAHDVTTLDYPAWGGSFVFVNN